MLRADRNDAPFHHGHTGEAAGIIPICGEHGCSALNAVRVVTESRREQQQRVLHWKIPSPTRGVIPARCQSSNDDSLAERRTARISNSPGPNPNLRAFLNSVL